MNALLVYASNSTLKSLWQKYEIFADRVELHSWVGNIKIPFDQVEKIEVYPPVLKSLRLHMKNCLPFGLHLDAVNFKEHVVLDKRKDSFAISSLLQRTPPNSSASWIRFSSNFVQIQAVRQAKTKSNKGLISGSYTWILGKIGCGRPTKLTTDRIAAGEAVTPPQTSPPSPISQLVELVPRRTTRSHRCRRPVENGHCQDRRRSVCGVSDQRKRNEIHVPPWGWNCA